MSDQPERITEKAESDRTEARERGWLVPHGMDPAATPALLRTVNGTGWYLLLADGDYQWVDREEELDGEVPQTASRD